MKPSSGCNLKSGFYIIKLCWTTNLYILLITENTTGMTHPKTIYVYYYLTFCNSLAASSQLLKLYTLQSTVDTA